MAARTRKIFHDDKTKRLIQASQLLNRLKDHAEGRVELSTTQVRAAEIVIRKFIPDLATVAGPGPEGEHVLKIKHEMT